MNKIIFTLLCLITSMTANAQTSSNYGNVAKGEKPPTWLKNKVSEAQYDSIAELAKYYGMNYTCFKCRNLTPKDIRSYMNSVKSKLENKEGLKDAAAKGITYGGPTEPPVKIKPMCLSKSDDGALIDGKFVIYSEIDGFDAHVVINAKFGRMLATEKYYSDKFSVEGFSLSSLPVSIRLSQLRQTFNNQKVDKLELSKDGTSPLYTIFGTLEYEDAMGNKHFEPFIRQFSLDISQAD